MTINVDELFDVANQDGEEAWHQQPDEPDNWYLLFMRYCRRGPTRSILGIFNEYRVEQGHKRALRVSGGFERRTKKA